MSTPRNYSEAEAQRIFAAGYMLGGKRAYQSAVEESYPELREGQTEVGVAIQDELDGFFLPKDPNEDFS